MKEVNRVWKEFIKEWIKEIDKIKEDNNECKE